MKMKITDAAKEQLKKIYDNGHYLRIAIERTGCCGFGFQTYEDVERKGDILEEVEGEKLLLTPRAKEMLEMQVAELDYRRKGIRKDFWIKYQ